MNELKAGKLNIREPISYKYAQNGGSIVLKEESRDYGIFHVTLTKTTQVSRI